MTTLFARDKTPHLTSYDLVKTFALITMIIDHLGAFLFPDLLILKAVGRLSFPVWFFLVGYSNTRTIPPRLWIGAGLITLSYIVFHHQLLPFNIFVTIIVARLVLPFITRKVFYNIFGMAGLLLVCIAVLIPSYGYIEYGVTGILLAFWAHLRRKNPCSQWLQHLYFLIILVVHASIQTVIYPFSGMQQNIVFFGVVGVMMGLHFYFKSVVYQGTENVPIVAPILRLCGRYTLEIYGVHIIVFTILSAYLYGDFETVNFFGISLEIPAGGFTRK